VSDAAFLSPCSIFLKELEKYEQLPEDVGHCFVTWVTNLSSFFHCPRFQDTPSTTAPCLTWGLVLLSVSFRTKGCREGAWVNLWKAVSPALESSLIIEKVLSCQVQPPFQALYELSKLRSGEWNKTTRLAAAESTSFFYRMWIRESELSEAT
jgi:hypothetical protein